MKNVSLTTEKIVEAFKVLDEARYQKLSDDDKIKVWKISRKLSPIAEKYKEDSIDAEKKLIPYEDFPQKIQKVLAYEKMMDEGKKDNLPMTAEEHAAIAKDYFEFKALHTKVMTELKEKEQIIEFEPISEEGFSKLMASNDWTLKQVDALEFIIEQ